MKNISDESIIRECGGLMIFENVLNFSLFVAFHILLADRESFGIANSRTQTECVVS